MRHRLQWIIGLLLLAACRELPPPGLVLHPRAEFRDTTYVTTPPVAEPRKVLIEEFTGVQCTNCVAGHDALEQIAHAYPDRVVIVSYHTGIFSVPLPESKYDFRTDEAPEIALWFGGLTATPAAVFNRSDYDQDGELMVTTVSAWNAAVASALDSPTITNFYVQIESGSEDTLSIVVEAHFVESYPRVVALSIALIQDSILDAQSTPQGVVRNYLQRWVFRQYITHWKGDNFYDRPEAGRFIRRVYRIARSDLALLPEGSSYVCAWLHGQDPGEPLPVLAADCDRL